MTNWNFSTFQDIPLSLLNKLASIKKKICRYKHNAFMNKSLKKAIRNRSKLNPVQDGSPLPKIYRTYPTIMKLDTVIPYLEKIQKIYKSCDTLLEFC